MTIDFRDYFWGEKNNGFDVLYQNMKCGHLASKELTDFIRERSLIEENNSKLLTKLSKQANNNSIQGTFLPLWKVLKSSSEKLSSLHMQMVHGFQELIKELNKYSEEQHKKQKQIKSEEFVTVEVVGELKDTIASLNKAKEFYNAKVIECERLKRENGSQKEIEKAEIRLNKACTDYKSLIDKYANVKEDFEKKFGVSCQHFQQIEEAHIKQMKDFLANYSQVLESGHALIGQVHLEFKEHCNDMNVNKLLEQFVKIKGTGTEKPELMTFEEADISALNSMKSTDLLNMTNGDKTVKKEGFLKSKREKVKEKKKKKKSDNSSFKEDNCSIETKDSNSIDLSSNPSNTEIPAVDDEGYIIRPNAGNQTNPDNNFYSSSDSDSEEEKERKIRIKINPLTNGAPISASVDELIARAGTLSLSPITQHTNRRIYASSTSPTPEDGPIKRSVSANQTIFKGESDLISVFSSSMSSASTPSGIPDQNPSNYNSMNTNSVKNPSADRYAALSDLFTESLNESNEIRSTPMLSKSMSASILGPPMLASVPRPTSKRNTQTSPQLSHQSSQDVRSNISRCESVSSLSSDFRMTPISVGSSRGPSPLTLGISDAVPIAIALQESVSACFKGIDETKCQVQVIGSLKMAFPAGIVQAFANNPYAAPLTFKLNKSSKIDKIYPNKELLIENSESSQMITNDTLNFEVNMSSLLSSIRRLYEQSPNSRYYNIDVLKYQMRCLQGARSTPLQLVSYWKCEPQSTSLKIDYKFNASALAQVEPLRNISLFVNIDGGPHAMQSRPDGKWNPSAKQAMWRFDQISHNSDTGGLAGLGSIKAKFDLTSGPSNASVIQAQFTCLDTTISGVDFELTSVGYRVSLVKKQITSGRYICEA